MWVGAAIAILWGLSLGAALWGGAWIQRSLPIVVRQKNSGDTVAYEVIPPKTGWQAPGTVTPPRGGAHPSGTPPTPPPGAHPARMKARIPDGVDPT